MTILLLAGTGEARALSHAIAPRSSLIASLAGATDAPLALGGQVRTGGFGGASGLAAFIRDRAVRLVIDATHPFAATMSANAHAAARDAGCALLQLNRPPWPTRDGWRMVPDLAAAAAALPHGATAFLATGRGSIPHFENRADVTFVVRVMDDRPGPFPLARGRFLPSRPPFTVEQETATLRREGIDILVSRNSGGTGGTEKLDAAARLSIPVIMAERPAIPAAARVDSVDAAMAWLEAGAWLDA